MSISFKTEEYYKRFIELQEKLRKSEEERLKLEMKFNEMVRITREEEQTHYRKLRAQYKRFLEEDRRRQDRNERIIRSLERIESRVSMLVAKTERFKLLRKQYQTLMDRVYRDNQIKKEESLPPRTVKLDERKPRTDDNSDIVQTYLQNLSSNKLREMLKKEEEARAKLPTTTITDHDEKYNYSDLHAFTDAEFRPNYANTIADDIMNSIYLRNRPLHDSNKLNQPREFNNNISVTPVGPPDEFRPQTLKKYDDFIGISPQRFKKDETKNIISGAEDTETDDFSESDEILYKNPTEFNKTKRQNLNQFDKNKISHDITFNDPFKTDEIENISNKQPLKNITAAAIESSAEKPKDEFDTSAEIKDSPGDVHEQFISNIASVDDNICDNISKDVEISENEDFAEKSSKLPEISSEDDILQSKESIMQPVVTTNENNITSNTQEKTETPDVTEESKNDPDKQKNIEDIVQERSLHMEPEREPLQEFPPEETLEQNIEISNDNELQKQEFSEFAKNEIPSTDANEEVLENNYQQQPPQQYLETEHPAETNYEESSNKDLSETKVNEPVQQYDETSHAESYDQYNQPIYDTNNPDFQQFDQNGQPVQLYDEQNQFVQNYDESGQPIGQFDENSQPLQQYDEHGQPIQSYDEQGQLIQQYDEHGQFLQHYDENAQYDEHGQLVPQYDEQGQLIQQYDDSGQAAQHYDEQYVEGQSQYDEHGQLIQNYDYSQAQPQYDENGQLIQQNFDEQQYYPQQYEENVEPADGQHSDNPSVPQDVESGSGVNVSKEQEEIKEEEQEVKKTSNVMEMLDTDTESVKQDTKISHDSDFDFSNG
ncbi:putative mediator of RNA polymerase II transcription subunit 26 [Zophobas morio]|uniref:putative mediator of RNA polymerase II transcription subunit 26 n=1 Tax=Zophobas morio TaxID=2755281 RepID=UPI003083AFD0